MGLATEAAGGEMELIAGLAVMLLGLLAWLGQTISWFAPGPAARMGLSEREDDVDAPIWADFRGEARWDALSLWPMVVAGGLLAFDHGSWPYFALGSGGAYLYFAGRGISSRLAMARRGVRFGAPESTRVAWLMLLVWAVMAAALIVGAVMELEGR